MKLIDSFLQKNSSKEAINSTIYKLCDLLNGTTERLMVRFTKLFRESPEEQIKCIFSSPEQLGSQGELIVYPSSRRPSIVRQPFSKIFFSETAWPIKAKFYVEPSWEGGTKVCINGPGHMTKMAATPIYGKNPSKIFFSGTGGPISTKLGM